MVLEKWGGGGLQRGSQRTTGLQEGGLAEDSHTFEGLLEDPVQVIHLSSRWRHDTGTPPGRLSV